MGESGPAPTGEPKKDFRTRQAGLLEGSEKLPTHFDVCACLHECIVNPSTTFLHEGTGWLGAAHTENELLKNYQSARPNLAGEMAENSPRLSQVHQNESSDNGVNGRAQPEPG
jgi:hypothetical protein